MTNTTQGLKNLAAQQDTATLLGALRILDAKGGNLDAAERMTHAATADVITERHDLDALMDDVFMDLDFTGTYLNAIEICLVIKGIEV